MPVDPRDTSSIDLLADQLDALDECLALGALAAGGLAGDLTQHGAHPAIAGTAERIRRHLEHARGSVGAAAGLIAALWNARDRSQGAQDGPERPAWPAGPVCTCEHVKDVHNGPDGWCASPAGCDCARFTARGPC